MTLARFIEHELGDRDLSGFCHDLAGAAKMQPTGPDPAPEPPQKVHGPAFGH